MSFFQDQIKPFPAYADIFKLGGYDRYKKQVVAVISERGIPAVSPVPELLADGREPIMVRGSFADQDFFRPVMGMRCDLSIHLDDDWKRLLRFAKGDETKYRVQVYENYGETDEELIFWGFINPQSFRQEYGVTKPWVDVSAVDGLALLKDIPFLPDRETPVYGTYSIRHVLSYLFNEVGNMRNWYDGIQYSWLKVPKGFALTGSIPVADYFGKSCYYVLEDIMGMLRSQVCMWKGHYLLRTVDTPALQMLGREEHWDEYDYEGNLINHELVKEIPVMMLQDVLKNGGVGDVRADQPVRKLHIDLVDDKIDELIFNNDFTKEDAGWENKVEGFGTINRFGIALPSYSFYSESEGRWVKTNIFRGNLQTDTVRLTFTMRLEGTGVNDETKWGPVVSMGTAYWNAYDLEIWQGPGPHTITLAAFNWNITTSAEIKFFAIPAGIVRVLEVSAETRNHYGSEIPSAVDRDTFEINEYSVRDVVEEIKHRGKNLYSFHNALVKGSVYSRAVSGFISDQPMAVERLVSNRLRRFYRHPKTRLTVNGLLEPGVLFPPNTYFECLRMNATYTLSSTRYNPLSKQIRMELLEYAPGLLSAPEEPELFPWILEEGIWNDDGIWKDTAQWNDG